MRDIPHEKLLIDASEILVKARIAARLNPSEANQRALLDAQNRIAWLQSPQCRGAHRPPPVQPVARRLFN